MGEGEVRAEEDPLGDLSTVGALTFSAAGNLYATHGLHAFAARCPPPLVDWAITHYSRPGELVLDPMAGSGTALVEACLLGRAARGVDIDPLARLISKAKATPVDLRAFEKAATEVERLLADGTLDDGWRPALADWDRWFRPEVAADLSRLRHAISSSSIDPNVTDLFWVVFSSLIVARTSVANARDLVHSRHHHQAWSANPGTLGRFSRRLRQVHRMMADYLSRLDGAGHSADVALVGNDARCLPLEAGTADLIFTSPPYCSALDYTRAHLFAVAWMNDVLGTTVEEFRMLGRRYLGTERAPLAEAGVRRQLPPPLGVQGVDRVVADLAEEPRRAWIVHRYFREMGSVLAECARVTRPGGHVVLVVCPSNIRKVVIPTHRLLAERASQAGAGERLETVACHERTIHDGRRVMPYLESAFGPRMRTEYVLILRRPPQEKPSHG